MIQRDEVRRPPGWSVRRRLLVWFVGSGFGVAIIALPDFDNRVFSLSRTHGPSAVDLLGVHLLLAAWIPIPVLLWHRRRAFTGRLAGVALVLGVAGVLGLVVTVGFDLGTVYLVPVLLLLASQLLAVHIVARGNE